MAWVEIGVGSVAWSDTDVTDSGQEIFDQDIFDSGVFQCATPDWGDEQVGTVIWR